MFPAFAIGNHANNRGGNAIFGGEFSAVAPLVSSANLANVLRGKLGIVTFFAMLRTLAAFCHHVVNIVLERTNKQVRRIHARWIVAGMANKHAAWNRTARKFIACAMRHSIGMVRTIHANVSVAIYVAVCGPLPTVGWTALVDLLPEAVREWLACVGYAASTVPNDKAAFSTWKLGFGKWRAATTGTEFWGGIVRGMIVHSNGLLTAVAHATGHSQCRRGNFIGSYSTIIAQMGSTSHIANLTLDKVMQPMAHANFV
jgi:hypothetical protein